MGGDRRVTRDAAEVARGSLVALAGGFVDRGLRFALTWLLSGGLGPAAFGVYALAVNWATLASSLGSLGLNSGMVFFASRYRGSGERRRLRTVVLLGGAGSLVLAALVGLGLAGAVLAGIPLEEPGLDRALVLAAPGAALRLLLMFCVGLLVGARDMRGFALALQVVLPGATLLASAAVLALGGGLQGAIGAFVGAMALAAGLATRRAWRWYGEVLSDRGLGREPGMLRPLLGFSVPAGLNNILNNLNLWMDVLMLGWLATSVDVGLYRVAASLATLAAIPVVALTAIFRPVIAGLVYGGEVDRLDALLKLVTRWLSAFTLPVLVGLAILPEVPLALFDDAYAVSAAPLVVLVAGQFVRVACAPTAPVVSMSGHVRHDLAAGLAAVGLNVVLNLVLIPRWGAVGAAAATAAATACWSLLRVVQVRLLVGCVAFEWRGLVLLGIAGTGTLAGRLLLAGAGIGPRAGLLAVLLLAHLAALAAVARTPADRELLRGLVRRLRALGGR